MNVEVMRNRANSGISKHSVNYIKVTVVYEKPNRNKWIKGVSDLNLTKEEDEEMKRKGKRMKEKKKKEKKMQLYNYMTL